MSGIDYRLGQLFDKDSGRSFTVAFDHGQALPIPGGLGNPINLLEKIIAGEPDGILLTAGMMDKAAHLFAHRGAPTPIVRADWATLNPAMVDETGEFHRPIIEPEEALAMGASAICTYFIARPERGEMFANNVQSVARTIQKAHRVGLPVIVEAVLWGSRVEDQRDFESLRYMCRMAVELGADAVKTQYVGDVTKQAQIIDELGGVPVLTLGGAVTGSNNVSDEAKGAIDAGARGLIFGRNVWQVENMGEVMADLAAIVHA